MCDHCDDFLPSRRTALKTLALSAAGILAACSSDPTALSPATAPATAPDPTDQLEGETPKPLVAETRPIVIPPPLPPRQTEYGELMPRAAWTTTPMEFKRGKLMAGISRITLHHSGDGKAFLGQSVADVARHLQIVQRAHFQRGMIDIAYHFAVDPAGRVWQLRSLQYEGQHVRVAKNGTRWNAHNLGIVSLGDFNIQPPTVAQRTRLVSFAHLIRQKFKLSAAAVHMHGELVQTDCPGKNLVPWIREARGKGLL